MRVEARPNSDTQFTDSQLALRLDKQVKTLGDSERKLNLLKLKSVAIRDWAAYSLIERRGLLVRNFEKTLKRYQDPVCERLVFFSAEYL